MQSESRGLPVRLRGFLGIRCPVESENVKNERTGYRKANRILSSVKFLSQNTQQFHAAAAAAAGKKMRIVFYDMRHKWILNWCQTGS